jgi:hypothetical protein
VTFLPIRPNSVNTRRGLDAEDDGIRAVGQLALVLGRGRSMIAMAEARAQHTARHVDDGRPRCSRASDATRKRDGIAPRSAVIERTSHRQ